MWEEESGDPNSCVLCSEIDLFLNNAMKRNGLARDLNMRNTTQTWCQQHVTASSIPPPGQRLETLNLRQRDPYNTELCTELSVTANQSVIFV